MTRLILKRGLWQLYNTSFVYCRGLAPAIVSLTGDWDRGYDSKQYMYYS